MHQTNFGSQNVRFITNPVSIAPKTSAFYDDFAYAKYKDYIIYLDPKKNTITYPFRNIIDSQNRLLTKTVLPSYSDNLAQQDVARRQNLNECGDILGDAKSERYILKENAEEFVRYSSLSGSFCDHYAFDLPRNQAYLISFISRNRKGLPLKLCVANYVSERCDLYAQLKSFSAFNEEVFLLPPLDESIGFNIQINNFAITKSPSVNDLKSIKVTPFPYTALSQIEEYSANDNPKNVNVITFFQSFNNGWKAYQTNFQFSIFNYRKLFHFYSGKN